MKRSGEREIARHRVIGGCTMLEPSVIPSEARRYAPCCRDEWREVEGPRECFDLPCSQKAFSREFPDTLLVTNTSSGSFDSPSPRLGLAQDDRGGLCCSRPQRRFVSGFILLKETIQAARRTLLAPLREISDENAYDSFLMRTHAVRSVASYREFLREREAAMVRKPRCC